MRKLAGQIAAALVLFGLGLAFWTAGRLEARVADAHEDLALLQYKAADVANRDIEESAGYARRIPWVGDALVSDVEEHRAAADYWQGRYDALGPQHDTRGATIEQPPTVMAVAANASFRSGQRESADRQATLRRLDASLKNYTEVLKKNP